MSVERADTALRAHHATAQLSVPSILQQPLRRKLPLLISALVFVVVAVLSALGYEQVQRAMLAAAGQQVANAAQQVGGMLHESALGLRRTAHLAASDTAVISLLRTGSPSSRSVVERSFRNDMSRMPQIIARSVRTRDGTLRLTLGTGEAQRHPPELPDSGDAPSLLGAHLSSLRTWKDAITYDVVALSIVGRDTLGYFVETRRLWDGQSLKRVRDLIGAGSAALLLGNKDGSLWTNGIAMVAAPPRPTRFDVSFEYQRAGLDRVGAADAIASTPWVVAIEIPRTVAVLPARRFLYDASGLAVVLIALGAMAAWALSRSITRPLDDLSRVAQGIAEGDYTRRASVSPHTELGLLAASFNSMAARVEAASQSRAQQASDARASAGQLEAANRELERALADAQLSRREAERAARAREDTQSLLDSVLSGAPVGFALIDRELRYLRVNEALAMVNGQPVTAHIGRYVRELQPELGGEHEELLRRVLETREAAVDVELLRNDGSSGSAERQLRASFFPVGVGEGPPLGIGMFVAETTERRGLEAQLQQAQKMEAVGQLAGGIAHDFNNLLTVITSYSAMLMADLPRESPHATDVQEIMSAANRASSLTRQLLAFSRRQVLQPNVLDLNALTGNLEKMLRRLLREDIQLATRFDPDLALVNADAGQLEQVIVNLVVNARDAMPRGGRLSIETANITLGPGYGPMHANAAPGPYVLLAVSDTGMGMDKETQAHIFEPFFTTKPVGQGTGLGLSTVYGIIKQSGGYVWVYSEMGRGTTFKVYLPAVPDTTNVAEPERESPPPAASAPERILLVEDEPNVRRIARRILERNGYTVLEAANGNEALRVLERRREPIALVLTDLVMPEMGGRELAARLRSVSPTSRVLFMSGYTEDAVLRQSVMEPGAIFLDKPFTFDTLIRKVREALSAA
jgi:signal transduction histidine kinase/HAMP domain-containing protein